MLPTVRPGAAPIRSKVNRHTTPPTDSCERLTAPRRRTGAAPRHPWDGPEPTREAHFGEPTAGRRMDRGRRGPFRPLALRERRPAAPPHRHRGRPDEGRRRLQTRLRGHRAAVARRLPQRPPVADGAGPPHRPPPAARRRPPMPAQAFHLHRAAQNHRARILGMLLVPLERPSPSRCSAPPTSARPAPGRTAPASPPPEPQRSRRRHRGPGPDRLPRLAARAARASSAPTNGAGRASRSRRSAATVSTRITASSPRPAGEYVDLVAEAPLPARRAGVRHRHRHRRTGLGAGPARCAHGSWPPTRIRGRWPVPARTPHAWASPVRWR